MNEREDPEVRENRRNMCEVGGEIVVSMVRLHHTPCDINVGIGEMAE